MTPTVPTPPSVELADLMGVLDQAEQARSGSEKKALRAALGQLTHGYTSTQIETALEAHLAGVPLATSAATGFGWNRPNRQARNAYFQAQTRGWRRLMGRWVSTETRSVVTWAISTLLVSAGVTTWTVLAQASLAREASVFGVLVLAGGLGILMMALREHWIRFEGAALGDKLIKAALESPQARAYLRAVLASDVPLVMNSDHAPLQRLIDADAALLNAQAGERELDHLRIKLAQPEPGCSAS